jgi:hypothetical protein
MTPVTSLVVTGDFFGKKGSKPVTSLVKMACNSLKSMIVLPSKDILKIYLRGETALPLRAGISPFRTRNRKSTTPRRYRLWDTTTLDSTVNTLRI